ncbi:MAG: hypothetical protein C4617_00645 [Candidatus Liberibacter europaeus]|uniref:Uncharacterized protein n=1 Tax=Candidatus Liberibacter europaeus TaxID=744859 RepID=A0A2T4VYU4_9HYPH|nr:MAG: hypothetical protein C4617_00645 [Candidatus Liberibacter europaeus]
MVFKNLMSSWQRQKLRAFARLIQYLLFCFFPFGFLYILADIFVPLYAGLSVIFLLFVCLCIVISGLDVCGQNMKEDMDAISKCMDRLHKILDA